MMTKVEQSAMADVDHRCPRCSKYRALRKIDMSDDGLPDIWACRWDKGGCGWHDCHDRPPS
jgi:hypothetical protein